MTRLSSTTVLLLLAFVFPLTILLWVSYLAILHVVSNDPEKDQVPPTRWFASILLPFVVILYGLRRQSLSRSGAALAGVVGFVLTLSNYCFVADLLTFFFTGSRLTKFRSDKKKFLEKEFKEGGQRNWVQVLCNGGMLTILAALYIMDVGVGETPADFSKNYRATWLTLGVLGACACSNGDTWASEVGSVIGGAPILITSGKKVPRGTNGAITLGGLACSLAGGLLIGLSHYVTTIFYVDEAILRTSSSQWPVIIIGGLAGLLGSILDSILGATLQYSGLDKKSGCIVEHPGPNVSHLSGRRILDNNSVNLLTSVAAGILTPVLAHAMWA